MKKFKRAWNKTMGGNNTLEMKKTKAYILATIAICLCSCINQQIVFDDYDIKAVYFPYQYPVRTLSLGKDITDNSLDRNHEFNIGICIGGYYGASKDNWNIEYVVDTSLIGGRLYNVAGEKLTAMPDNYYSLEPNSRVVLKRGTSAGLIHVRLKDDFFQDPKALTGSYVIPLRITKVDDPLMVISGQAKDGIQDPCMHSAEDWDIMPKDFTLFGVKYINKFHGSWLRRGTKIERSNDGKIVSKISYHAKAVEFDEVVYAETTSMNSFRVSLNIGQENWKLDICDCGDGELSLKSSDGSAIEVVVGTGKYIENGDTWGGTPDNPTKRDAIYLNYFYRNNSSNLCEICDTLVFRDRGIKLEVESPIIH